ncbi:MAG: class I SAM-dependent methyltransferase [Clostridia bacterium]|jgi:tRNA (cmo5U34)-methyltransferase|nr:class I SAM-dependent methyltransferase [Clostridia bacterium]MBT7122591.1 class I SAM-dependent methyltransferase [Clostridia bacterium]
MGTQSAWKDADVVKKYVENRRASFPYSIDQILVMLKLLHYNEKRISSFIDLGTGDGILAQLILQQYKEAYAYLLDFSQPMLDEAKKKMVKHKDNMQIINGDLSSPDWQKQIFKTLDEKVDAVVSGYTIHHLTHERKFELYSEIYSRLSDNGMFINLEHVSSRSPWGEMLADEAFIDSGQAYEAKLGGKRTREEIAEEFHNRPDKKDNILLSGETQVDWLRIIGFKRVDIYFKSNDLAVFAGTKL